MTLACFSLFMAAAGGVGSFIPAVTLAHFNSPSNWTIFWTVLANGSAAGACVGVLCGLFFMLAFTIFQPHGRVRTSTARALDMLNFPLFILGLANGTCAAIITDTAFHGKYIWQWWPSS